MVGLTRRDFLGASAGILASSYAANATSTSRINVRPRSRGDSSASPSSKPNILFVFTDQERFFSQLPSAFSLPGHDRLAELGTRFTSHQISACMCTSSRSVMLTGLQTTDNGMFENVDMSYVKDLSTSVPTLGHMLRKAGYYTAYKGKWHLNRNFEAPPSRDDLNAEMEKYGFSDFYSPGDSLAHALGGYNFDNMIGNGVISWLRNKGRSLNDGGTPWSLTVSLINPHDIMYFNADLPSENIQDTGKLLMQAARAPQHKMYLNDWKYGLSKNWKQLTNEMGRPSAHDEYHKAWGYCLGHIPLEEDNWNRFTNFYLNSIRSVDLQVYGMINELESLGLLENTVVVFTADHGEMGGAHGLRGKGPFAYREILNVPMYVIHPDVKGGRECSSLTSHIDIVPTLLSVAGVKDNTTFAGRPLPGCDFSNVLTNPSSAGINDVREASLFSYSGISTNDSEVIRIVAEAKAAGKNPKEAVKQSGYQPNLLNRGTVRSVFDGRYKFSRYFSPIQRHSPTTIDELYKYNDVELFDLQQDPGEMRNLAQNRFENQSLIMDMSVKLENIIAHEMGRDDGREMPVFQGMDWSIDRLDL